MCWPFIFFSLVYEEGREFTGHVSISYSLSKILDIHLLFLSVSPEILKLTWGNYVVYLEQYLPIMYWGEAIWVVEQNFMLICAAFVTGKWGSLKSNCLQCVTCQNKVQSVNLTSAFISLELKTSSYLVILNDNHILPSCWKIKNPYIGFLIT